MRRARKMALCTGVACAAITAPAQAGTLLVFQGREYSRSATEFRVTYTGDAAANKVTAKWDASTLTYTITDKSGPIVPAVDAQSLTQCTYLLQTATCRPTAPQEFYKFNLDLGDGSDSASMNQGPASATLNGGPGNDHMITYGTGFAELIGHSGDDVLTGGPGRDFVHGGRGADRMTGGGGFDRLHWWVALGDEGMDISQNPTGGVRISVDGVADDGEPGERDNVTGGFEEVYGTGYADVIAGGPGDEHILALAGDDRISGGAGADHIDGSDGDDAIDTRDGAADRYGCGRGTDSVLADSLDAFGYLPDPWGTPAPPPNCESVTVE